MKRLAGIAFLLAATNPSLAADDPNAPLAHAKQELKQLQRDEAAKQSGAAGEKLQGALPKFHAPTPGQSEIDPSPARNAQKESERRHRASEGNNWLIEGYDQLDPKNSAPRGKRAAGKIDPREDEREPLRPGDTGYLLQLYEKQRREAAGAESRPGAARHNTMVSAQADPLAPYLKDWLANSPVRDVALGALGRRDPADTAGVLPDDGPDRAAGNFPNVPSSLGFDHSSRGRKDAAENPFLPTLAPTQPGGGTGGGPQGLAPASARLGAPAAFAPPRSLAVPLENPPSRRPDTRKPPPSQREEDRKYFPQLKRF